MVKLVDTPDLGSGAARRGSSSLSTRTNGNMRHVSSTRYEMITFMKSSDMQPTLVRISKRKKSIPASDNAFSLSPKGDYPWTRLKT